MDVSAPWSCVSARWSPVRSWWRCATREFRSTCPRMPMPDCAARLVFKPEYAAYDFGPEHPLRPERIHASFDLLGCLGIGPTPDEQLAPPPATRDELALVHDRRYIDAVQTLDP